MSLSMKPHEKFWRRVGRRALHDRPDAIPAGRAITRRRAARVARPSLETLERLDLLTTVQGTVFPLTFGSGTTPSGLSPAQVSQAYAFNTLPSSTNGQGTTIAILVPLRDPNIASDLHQFDSQFGLADPTLTEVDENGGTSYPATTTPALSIETSLDVEWAHAMAPGANILLVDFNATAGSGNAFSFNLSDLAAALDTARNYSGVVAVSMSFGVPDNGTANVLDTYLTTPINHNGVEFVAATGDVGGPASWPAVSPNVLAVGGTTLTLGASGGYGSEVLWSDSNGASGHGISTTEHAPNSQLGVSTLTTDMRSAPDVSYNAGTGVSVYDSFLSSSAPWLSIDGTSAGAPQWAAIIALADQSRLAPGGATLQGLAPFYNLPGSAFHYVVSGSPNQVPNPSFDTTTGRGSPIASTVVHYLNTDEYQDTQPIITYDPSAQQWFISPNFGPQYSSIGSNIGPGTYLVQFGQPGDIPVPGDYDNVGHMELALFRPSTQQFIIAPNWGGQYASTGGVGPGVYTVQFGSPGDIPIPGDYTADGHVDVAVFRPSTQQFIIAPNFGPAYSSTGNLGPGFFSVQFGSPGDIPIPGDYTGLGQTDIAVFRPSTQQFIVAPNFGPGYSSTGNLGPGFYAVQFGNPGDIPVPADYVGYGQTNVAVYRPSTQQFIIAPASGPQYASTGNLGPGFYAVQFGNPGDIPVPGNYDGVGHAELATYSPITHAFHFAPLFGPSFGSSSTPNLGPNSYTVGLQGTDGRIPVVRAIYLGADAPNATPSPVISVSYGMSAIQYPDLFFRGTSGTIPVPADYTANGTTVQAVYVAATQTWVLPGGVNIQFGQPGDIAVPADYDHVGHAELAVFNPITQVFTIAPNFGTAYASTGNLGPGVYSVQFGNPGDIPVPADYTGAGHADIAVFRPSNEQFIIAPNFGPAYSSTGNLGPGSFTVQFGTSGDVPIPADYTGAGHADIAIFRPSTQQFIIAPNFGTAYASTGNLGPGFFSVQFGSPGDIPVPADYSGAGHADVAVYRASTQQFIIAPNFGPAYASTGDLGPGFYAVVFGNGGDIAVPGAYHGSRTGVIGVFRLSTNGYVIAP